MPKPVIAVDPRYFQVIFQSIFLAYGLVFLHWDADWMHYVISIGCCLLFQYSADSVNAKRFLSSNEFSKWGFSILISAMSLCLLLKTNHWYISVMAAALTVFSKYIFRYNKRHFFNPSAFGIVATLLITHDAWLSPGQWGSSIIILFAVCSLGFIVVTRVQKLDISLAFLLTYVALLYWRQVVFLGWPLDFFLHSITTGSLLLFTFFMISDPKTSPNNPVARIVWAVLIAAIAFYLSAFKWKYNTAIWVLVFAAPLVPLLNLIFKAKMFEWTKSSLSLNLFYKLKSIIMRPFMKKIAAMFILSAMIAHETFAFCGFYVSKADGTLKNKTSQVILVRDGNKNVITMYNDFKGDLKDFAMVVPVPVVLKERDIKVVDQRIFDVLNDYSKPRLVEYYDQNPCNEYREDKVMLRGMSSNAMSEVVVTGFAKSKDLGVTIEAKYLVGEYDILILSAKESSGLKEWLTGNGYKIPTSAEEVLEPYIKSNLKFFVVKVNEKAKKKIPGNFLRPIQITFSSPKFMLPIRLGMANADGDQDMIVYAFTKKGRVECTNYRSVSLPTGKNIPLFVKNNFGNFYSNLFQHQWKKEGKSVSMLEYAWDVSPKNYVKCDPCVSTAPAQQDLVQAGVWWLSRDWNNYDDVYDNEEYSDNVFFTRLHVRYNRNAFPQDLVFQVTPNKENYQARYVITHPATGDFNCDEGKKYLKELKQRRHLELETLASLTGKSYEDWDLLAETDEKEILPVDSSYPGIARLIAEHEKESKPNTGLIMASLALLGFVAFATRPKK